MRRAMKSRPLLVPSLFIFSLLLLHHSYASEVQNEALLPSPPLNVQVTALNSANDGPVITASWGTDDNCRGEPDCIEPLGYRVSCCIPGKGIEINTTVLESDIAGRDPISVDVTGLSPATQYVCKVAAFNGNGVGNSGSNVFVETLDAVPRIAPSQVYTSDMQKDSIRVNWYYSETPPPGDISTFKIEIYYKDNRYPGRNGEHVRDTFYNLAESERSKVTFSYLLIYLEPGTEYNVLIRAVTSAGVGPAARVWQKTVSTVPAIVPHGVTGGIRSYVHSEPPSFSLQWSVRDSDRHLLHDIAGFIISCSGNTTTPNNDIITFSEPIFIESNTLMHTTFSGIIYFPESCRSGLVENVSCAVSAFNNRGPGETSNTVTISLPCLREPLGGLENSFLADPNTSLGLLGVVVLLVLGLAVAVAAALCACNSCNGQQRKGNILSHSSSMDNYIPMASTDTGMKPQWTEVHASEAGGPGSNPVGVVMIENGDPAYDEIPADRQDNLYDEIHPRSCGGGARTQDSVQLKTPTTRSCAVSGDSLQTIPLPSSPHSEAVRNSTTTEYMELTSPLLGGDVTNGNTTRYSVADSGVNMTSLDVEHSLNLDPRTNLPQKGDVENLKFRRYPYFITDIPVSGHHHDDNPDTSGYGTMTPYSVSKGLELTLDMQLVSEEEMESGIGMELSQKSESGVNSRPRSKSDVESSQKVLVGGALQVEPIYSKVKKREKYFNNHDNRGRSDEGEREGDGGKEGGKEGGEEERESNTSGDKDDAVVDVDFDQSDQEKQKDGENGEEEQ